LHQAQLIHELSPAAHRQPLSRRPVRRVSWHERSLRGQRGAQQRRAHPQPTAVELQIHLPRRLRPQRRHAVLAAAHDGCLALVGSTWHRRRTGGGGTPWCPLGASGDAHRTHHALDPPTPAASSHATS
jgi:hypothetical protein